MVFPSYPLLNLTYKGQRIQKIHFSYFFQLIKYVFSISVLREVSKWLSQLQFFHKYTFCDKSRVFLYVYVYFILGYVTTSDVDPC